MVGFIFKIIATNPYHGESILDKEVEEECDQTGIGEYRTKNLEYHYQISRWKIEIHVLSNDPVDGSDNMEVLPDEGEDCNASDLFCISSIQLLLCNSPGLTANRKN